MLMRVPNRTKLSQRQNDLFLWQSVSS